VVQPFTAIDDGGAGDSILVSAVTSPYPGTGTNLLDAIALAVNHYSANAGTLPAGPKAVIVITDGGENSSAPTTTTTDVIGAANAVSLPLFTIGIGNVAVQDTLHLLTSLPSETGGDYIPAPTNADISDAYATISQQLDNEYLLTYASTITDCNDHTLEVSVTGQPGPVTATFSRCSPQPASSGGGGGGSIGVTGVLLILGAAAFRRRLRR
jgi:hypothetical protein